MIGLNKLRTFICLTVSKKVFSGFLLFIDIRSLGSRFIDNRSVRSVLKETLRTMDRSKSMDDMPELVGARPKTQAARERARLQLERTRSNSRGRTMHTRRTRATAAEIEDDSTPTRRPPLDR